MIIDMDNSSFWYKKLFCDIAFFLYVTNSILWHYHFDFVIKQFDFVISQIRFYDITKIRMDLWFSKSHLLNIFMIVLCHTIEFWYLKFNFVISQIWFCLYVFIFIFFQTTMILLVEILYQTPELWYYKRIFYFVIFVISENSLEFVVSQNRIVRRIKIKWV